MHTSPPRSARSPFAGLESLEPRVLLTTFALDPFPGVAPGTALEFQLERPAVAVMGAGDINGDGIGDFAVSLAGDDDTPGEVRLFSGADASLIRTLADGASRFGAALASPGDLTGDGVPDLLVSSPDAQDPMHPDADGGRGLVYLFSGADGALARTLAPAERHDAAGVPDEFGFAIALVADVTGDGVVDLLVGAPGAGDADQGQAFLFSGADGQLVFTLTGEAAGDEFGYAVADARDSAAPGRPADAVHDLLIGAPAHDTDGLEDAGRAYVFSGATGELLDTYSNPGADSEGGSRGPQAGARFGHALAANDESLVIGAPFYDNSPPPSLDGGRATHIFHDGSQTATIGYQAGTNLGERITPLGDPFRLAQPSIGITQPGYFAETGGTTIVDGLPISGAITAPAGDIDGDSFDDVISFLPGVGGANGTIRIYSSFHFRPRGPAAGASPGFESVWFNDGGLLLAGGEYTPYGDVPGLRPDDHIIDINARGDILGYGGGDTSQVFLVIGGDRTEIPDAITEIVGGELGQTGLRAVGLLPGGEAILAVPLASVWRFDDGVLTFLWDGQVNGITPSGAIVGSGLVGSVPRPPTYISTPDGQVMVIPNFTGLAIADNGVVAGFTPGAGSADPGQLALWIDGEITQLGGPGELPAGASDLFWRSANVTDDGNIIATLLGRVPSDRGTAVFTRTYYFSPQTGILQGEPAFSGDFATTPIDWDEPVLSGSGIYLPIEDGEFFRPADGAPVVSATDGGVTTVFSVNRFGEIFAISTAADGAWTGSRLPLSGPIARLGEGETFTAIADPTAAADVFLIISGPTRTVLLSRAQNFTSTLAQRVTDLLPTASPITGNLHAFSSTDGRIHLVGTNADGDWVSFFQTGATIITLGENGQSVPSPEWLSSNLTDDHLAPQSLSLPELSGVTTYVTPWDAFNILGLDAQGDIHALWWAPGLDGNLWRTDNMSAAARAAGFDPQPLTGNLTAFVTPWGTIHVAGTTAPAGTQAGGLLSILWWAPEFGGDWRTDAITTPDGAPSLLPGSLTTLITPWGGLSIAGVSTSGAGPVQPDQVAVYWWAPGTATPDNPAGWNLDSLHHSVSPTPPAPPSVAGAMASSVTADGGQFFFAPAADSSALLAFTWSPGDGSVWTFTNLTTTATLA